MYYRNIVYALSAVTDVNAVELRMEANGEC